MMEKILLWGTGQVAETLWRQCQTLSQYDLLGFIDNNPEKQGSIFKGLRVYSPSILDEIRPDFIVILTDACDEIRQQILSAHSEMESIIKNKNFFYMESLLKRYAGTTDRETAEVVNYIRENGLDVFNYEFTRKYRNLPVKTYFDPVKEMFYVYHYGKTLYFSRDLDSEKKVIDYYRYILMEQDLCSPHRYIADGFDVEEGDVVVDAGAAEGNFSLQIIDRASKVYIVETDENWVMALRETFRDYSDKVVIMQKFLFSYDEGKYAALDTLLQEPVNYIKMDIEGNEWDALQGAEETIRRAENLKCAVCSYHSDFDRILIENFMESNHLEHSVSPGLVWFPWTIRQNYVSTRLNKAIVRGIKMGK